MRVLVVRVGAMGDVLHGLPAVTALRDQFPEAFLGWAVEPHWRALLAGGHGGVVDRVHAVPVRAWKQRPFAGETVAELAGLRRELRAEQYDVCVDLQGSVRSGVISWMSGAGRRVGAATPREWPARVAYTEKVPVRAAHVTGQACELMGAAAGVRLAPAGVRLPVNEEAERWADGRVGAGGFCLLAPTAGWGAKEWGAERFGELARRLCAGGWRVLVNAGSEADGAAKQVAEAGGAERVVCGVAELVAMTRRAGLVIGGDTGPVHLASALRRPVVALFGPTDPARNGPAFPAARVRVLRDAASTVDHRRLRATEAGLARIGVEQVTHAVDELLRDGHGD